MSNLFAFNVAQPLYPDNNVPIQTYDPNLQIGQLNDPITGEIIPLSLGTNTTSNYPTCYYYYVNGVRYQACLYRRDTD
jgi:hypothetical protein